MDKFKAIVLLGIPAILLIAVAVLVLTNLGDTWTLHLYTTDISGISRGLFMVIFAAAGVCLFLLCWWMLPRGARALRAVRAKSRQAVAPAPPQGNHL
jgi:hypothetical protein